MDEVIEMASDSFVHVRVDSIEKQAAEQVLEELGLNMATTIRLLLKQIARERRVPLSLSLLPPANTYADALEARQARKNGFDGRDADEVIAEMERIAEGAEG
jgi:addiction module RelB/DinJ family antitoxin